MLFLDRLKPFSPLIIPRAKRAIIFVIFHKIFVDYNSSIDLTGNNGFEWGDTI